MRFLRLMPRLGSTGEGETGLSGLVVADLENKALTDPNTPERRGVDSSPAGGPVADGSKLTGAGVVDGRSPRTSEKS